MEEPYRQPSAKARSDGDWEACWQPRDLENFLGASSLLMVRQGSQ